MPKGRQVQGKKVAPATAVLKKQAAKKVVNPYLRKGPRILALDRNSSPKGPSPCYQMAPLHLAAAAKGCSLQTSKSASSINQFAQTLDPQTTTQLLKLPRKYSPRQSKRRSRDGWPGLQKQLQAKGMSPPTGPCPWSRVHRVTTLVENTWPADGDSTRHGPHQAGRSSCSHCTGRWDPPLH
uniref:Uncharacterized protein n=1 Tax=Pipistrellus kuhlii TaxID=59472 RepID=A0A7J8B172_PIPKU|nr:hypothetical protein mPipKuh1_007748 [Pipistrellus kuhlii]